MVRINVLAKIVSNRDVRNLKIDWDMAIWLTWHANANFVTQVRVT